MKIKKIHIVALCLVIVSSFLFTGCITAMLLIKGIQSSNRGNFLAKATGSPTDSVLVYGSFASENTSLDFFQADTTKPADYGHTYSEKNFWVSKPLIPGGRYKQYIGVQVINTGRSQTFYYYLYGLNGQNDLGFTTPKEPGLYFYGSRNPILALGSEMSIVKDKKRETKEELKALDFALKVYGKTDWAPLLKARIEELKNEE
ncbi:hypothetical protein V1L52_00675 [Treponema sp. HNW]|uniref:hypothetical protein n=1 Tax=Treponema sp. HNW TaxID=3116654 RepID=UPI003D0B7792